VTFLDLENAFGSIEHTLVSQTLSSIQLPCNVLRYLKNFYAQISGIIKGPFGKVHVPFKRGVFQGDPLSPLIFNLVIEPLLETLDHPDSEACAYADDSNLVTFTEQLHLQITERFNAKAEDMLLKIRPDKCVSIGIRQGELIPFRNVVNGINTGSLYDLGHLSYLGKLFCKGGDAEASAMILSKFRSKLQSIGTADVSRKTKTKIALDYLLPACYHDLMINDLTPDTLIDLDRLFTNAIISWSAKVQLLPNQIPSYIYDWLQTLKVYFLIKADDNVLESTISKYANTRYLDLAFAALDQNNPKRFIKGSIFGRLGLDFPDVTPFPVSSKQFVVNDVFEEEACMVYTDGSCFNNGTPQARAGFGVFWGDEHPLNSCGPVTPPTNNRGELTAVIFALRQALDGGLDKLTVCTDSQYVIKGVTEYLPHWRAKSFRKVKNSELWRALAGLVTRIPVEFRYTRGHVGIYGNEQADRLARQGANLDPY